MIKKMLGKIIIIIQMFLACSVLIVYDGSFHSINLWTIREIVTRVRIIEPSRSHEYYVSYLLMA
jgi:hypothetical protein